MSNDRFVFLQREVKKMNWKIEDSKNYYNTCPTSLYCQIGTKELELRGFSYRSCGCDKGYEIRVTNPPKYFHNKDNPEWEEYNVEVVKNTFLGGYKRFKKWFDAKIVQLQAEHKEKEQQTNFARLKELLSAVPKTQF